MSTRLTTLGLCLACLGPSAPLLAQAGLLVPTSSGRPDAAVLSLREMEVQAGLARGYARVSVRQVFENHTGQIQEGTYRFRLPLSAAVGDFAVWDGLMRIPGVIVEKRRARAIYRELTTQRIDPGLLQQGEEDDAEPGVPSSPRARPSGGSLFSVRVAPIPALGTKRLELQFQQEVPYLEGQALRAKALEPGSDVPAALTEARQAVGDGGRLVLFTDAPAGLTSKSLQAARGPAPLFTAISGEEAPESVRGASAAVLPPGATDLETDLFFKRLLGPAEKTPAATARTG